MATIAATLPKSRRPRKSARASSSQMCFPEFYFVKRIDNSRLRREVDPVRRRECFGLLGLCFFVFFFGLIFAWQHFQCVQYGYRLEQLKAQKATMEDWNHQLRLERASLADPQRIDRLAQKKLGLVAPSPQQVIRVGPASEPEGSVLARNMTGMGGAQAGLDRGQ
jgi:cell division protein FtsL